MRKIVSIFFAFVLGVTLLNGQTFNVGLDTPIDIPDSIVVKNQPFHVQGFEVDRSNGFIYLSFTNRIVKSDMRGRILGSVVDLHGHLGDVAYDPKTNLIYASLECKDDEIGTSISRQMELIPVDSGTSSFYVAVIDASKISKQNLTPEEVGMKRIYLTEVRQDYYMTAKIKGKRFDHKFGCSGIDGITIAPKIGVDSTDRELNSLYIAYGIYQDLERDDNDYQILLRYDLDYISEILNVEDFDVVMAGVPDKYYIYTGNTRYGVQNLDYDPFTNRLYMAVYKGAKPQFPNYSLYAVDVNQLPEYKSLKGGDKKHKFWNLKLSQGGKEDISGITGWDFQYGSCGFKSLDNGYYLVAEPSNNGDKHSCKARLYKWNNDKETPFVKVNRSGADWAKYSRYWLKNEAVEAKPKAVFMGNSITDMWESKHPQFFIDNNFLGRGISGQTTYQMLARMQRDVVDLAPEYLFILAGINDIAENSGYIRLLDVMKNIKSMCEIAKANGIIPVVCSVIPCDRLNWRKDLKPAESVKELNRLLKEYTASASVYYLDYYTLMDNGKGGLSIENAADGCHPTLQGYSIMEKAVLDFLNKCESEK